MMKKPKRYKIFLVDDHKLFLQGLRKLIEKQENLEIVGQANSGSEAIDLVEKQPPDIILMDVDMPDGDGIVATRQILAGNPKIKVIALSMHEDKHHVSHMLEAGATAYLLKDVIFEDLLQAIELVCMDQSYLSPKIAHVVVGEMAKKSTLTEEKQRIDVLSPREIEVLKLIAEGNTSKEIAKKLFISAKTVENHRKHIMSKLNIHSVAKLTKFALRHGLTQI